MSVWLKVRQDLDAYPITEGHIGGDAAMYVERYLLHGVERSVSGQRGGCLITQFGGARVQEGERGHWRTSALPSQSLLVPPHCPTHWHYAGPVDFAIFYFPEQASSLIERLGVLAQARCEPLRFGDALVSAAALQLLGELQKGIGADAVFMAKLAEVMLEQAYRTLTLPGVGGIHPGHMHFGRLRAVLEYIREHLADDLSVERLAGCAEVSVPHFRRIFAEAMGVPPHRHVLAARLEQARKLLSTTTMPISQIALHCGFSSQSHLTAKFRAAHAVAPVDFRARHRRGGVK